ncbi:YnfA family protein [Brevundimonas sp. BAL450]|uniref:YnfA family protein n=1 Tax=Brevundimonas sp. BAL450 TaxID=1708162 RepID=UPI0018CAE6AD|nr:YnfA family protein [Brevundimonas sp. BAL450]
MKVWLYYSLAAVAEIAGCFTFWMWLRQDRSIWWLAPGLLCLAAFAFFLTRVDVDAAGRTYAIYGGVYIAASLLWLWLVERQPPDRWDLLGAVVCLVGAGIILFSHRPA